jgi:hypothetical protein
MWLLAGAAALFFLIKNIFDNLFYTWLQGIAEAHLGVQAAEVTTKFADISVPLIGCIMVVWILNRRIRNELSPQIKFERHLESAAGDCGHYRAYLKVFNTSPYLKLENCRCEIVDLRGEEGRPIDTNIGLRTRHQEDKPTADADMELDDEVLTARVRAYGDQGAADETVVRIRLSDADFSIIAPQS